MRYGSTPFRVSGAVILATDNVHDAISWCRDCCSDSWAFELTQFSAIRMGNLACPLYCFYFASGVDLFMFGRAHDTQINQASLVPE